MPFEAYVEMRGTCWMPPAGSPISTWHACGMLTYYCATCHGGGCRGTGRGNDGEKGTTELPMVMTMSFREYRPFLRRSLRFSSNGIENVEYQIEVREIIS